MANQFSTRFPMVHVLTQSGHKIIGYLVAVERDSLTDESGFTVHLSDCLDIEGAPVEADIVYHVVMMLELSCNHAMSIHNVDILKELTDMFIGVKYV